MKNNIRRFCFHGLLSAAFAAQFVLGSTMSHEVVVPVEPITSDYLTNGATLSCQIKSRANGLVMEGPFTIVHTNGFKIAEGTYKQGKWDGEFLQYSEGRLVSRELYVEGKLAGTQVFFDRDGTIMRTTVYVDGEKHGAEYYWDSAGNQVSGLTWKRGDLLAINLYDNGVVTNRLSGTAAKEHFLQSVRDQLIKEAPAGEKGDGNQGPHRKPAPPKNSSH